MFVHDVTFFHTYVNELTGMRNTRLVTLWSRSERKLRDYMQSQDDDGLDISHETYSRRDWHESFLPLYKEIV